MEYYQGWDFKKGVPEWAMQWRSKLFTKKGCATLCPPWKNHGLYKAERRILI